MEIKKDNLTSFEQSVVDAYRAIEGFMKSQVGVNGEVEVRADELSCTIVCRCDDYQANLLESAFGPGERQNIREEFKLDCDFNVVSSGEDHEVTIVLTQWEAE